ncbi:MAG: ATP-binding protein [Thermomicrobiales bacterium]
MATHSKLESEETPPDPAATIETLGSLGYNLESALADLVDNSISAGAKCIEITMHWDGSDSWCAIVDDGTGMNESQLRRAMTIGSMDPLLPRDRSDLGRFGFGLKTASFSQCREVTVGSRTAANRSTHYRVWDLDYVRSEGRWLLGKTPSAEAQQILERLRVQTHGTVVLWRRLSGELAEQGSDADDQRAHQRFLRRVGVVERHLAMTFGRFLLRPEARLSLSINGSEIQGWDPFLADHPATQQLPQERLPYRGEPVLVMPYVLPHRSKLTAQEFEAAGGPAGWNAQQGFYVYRSDRLIQAGDWFARGQAKDNDHNLARIAIDVPPTLDREWALDVKKASVRPPGPLADDLRRIANATRRRAVEVYRHRGTERGRRPASVAEPVWRQIRKHGELSFRINRKHPLIQEILERNGGDQLILNDLIRVIEETIPVPLLPGHQAGGDRGAPDREADPELIALVERFYERQLQNGLTRSAARDRLLKIEPFNLYPDVIDRVVGGV